MDKIFYVDNNLLGKCIAKYEVNTQICLFYYPYLCTVNLKTIYSEK